MKGDQKHLSNCVDYSLTPSCVGPFQNDAFISNGNPEAFPIYTPEDGFLDIDFTVMTDMVLDAGTEVNDEIPANTAFLAQAAPDTGTDQNGVVEIHPGFGNGPGFVGPVAIPMYGVLLNADFQDDTRYPSGVVRIQVVFDKDSGGKKGKGGKKGASDDY